MTERRRAQTLLDYSIRKVWGTRYNTTLNKVSAVLKKLTSVGDKITVERETSGDGSMGNTQWWFILKGDEDILKKLEIEWNSVRLETGWMLQHCTATRIVSGASVKF